MLFLRNGAEFVTQAEIHSQLPGHAVVVLNKTRICPVMQVQSRVAYGYGCFEGIACEKILERSRSGIQDTAQERDAATGVAVGCVRDVVVVQLAAELQGMLAGCVGNVVNDLGDGVGPLELRPFETAGSGEITGKRNARQSAGVWPGHAGVKTVTGCRGIEIAGQGRL